MSAAGGAGGAGDAGGAGGAGDADSAGGEGAVYSDVFIRSLLTNVSLDPWRRTKVEGKLGILVELNLSFEGLAPEYKYDSFKTQLGYLIKRLQHSAWGPRNRKFLFDCVQMYLGDPKSRTQYDCVMAIMFGRFGIDAENNPQLKQILNNAQLQSLMPVGTSLSTREERFKAYMIMAREALTRARQAKKNPKQQAEASEAADELVGPESLQSICIRKILLCMKAEMIRGYCKSFSDLADAVKDFVSRKNNDGKSSMKRRRRENGEDGEEGMDRPGSSKTNAVICGD